MEEGGSRERLRARILAMMVLRVVIAIVFLGVTTWFEARGQADPRISFWPLYGVVVAIGSLTIFYSLYMGRARNLVLFTYGQVSVDIVLVTLIVFITGGVESYLPTLYFLSILGSSIVLGRRGGLFAASFASIAYGVLIDMDFYGWLPEGLKAFSPGEPHEWFDVLATVATNILAFFTVAYLSGYLAERTARAERDLEEKEVDFERLEELNRQIVENITSGIMTLDEDLRITSFNGAAEAAVGWSLREVYRKSVSDVFPGMLNERGSVTPAGLREEGSFARKDSTEVYLGYTISEGGGGDAARIVIFSDLTKIKGLEERLRRDDRLRALGELSVGIAHEIRNPLASISGSIQVLRAGLELADDDKRLMSIALNETERLNGLITDFLLFAKPARGKRGVINLTCAVAGALDIFRNSPEAGGISMESDMDDDIFVMGDERQMCQVFWNLFVNAAHAMHEGGRLKVSTRLLATAPGSAQVHRYVELRVADNGCGIAREDIGSIFDPFFSTKDGGTGLGLSVVHRIVESHDGSIKVTSTPGEGTVFRIVFPLAEEAPAAAAGEA